MVGSTAHAVSAYFLIIRGDAPIILTAPHGGSLSYPFPERSCTGNQVCLADTNTRQLTLAASDEFFAQTGKRPYVAVALGHRRYMDLNRSASAAYESPSAAPYYDFYHDRISGLIDDVREEFGRGLLIDVHGQSAEPGLVIRGTRNGATVAEMLGVFGEEALNGDQSIMGSLASQGFAVDPDPRTPLAGQTEDPRFNGGYTVGTYGSQRAEGIDSIQIEFGFDFRGGSAWEATAVGLANAMVDYADAYLSAPILSGDYNEDGVIDMADYTRWRDQVGAPAGSLPNGADGGTIGAAHYQTWRANYGRREVTAVGTPEPCATLLAATVAVLASVVTRCHARASVFPTGAVCRSTIG